MHYTHQYRLSCRNLLVNGFPASSWSRENPLHLWRFGEILFKITLHEDEGK
jgi:hypothetical protein